MPSIHDGCGIPSHRIHSSLLYRWRRGRRRGRRGARPSPLFPFDCRGLHKCPEQEHAKAGEPGGHDGVGEEVEAEGEEEPSDCSGNNPDDVIDEIEEIPKTTISTRIAPTRGGSIWPVKFADPRSSPYTRAAARRPTRKARATFTSFVNRMLPITAPTSARTSPATTPPRAAPNRNPTALPRRAPIMDMTVVQRPWP